MKIKPLFPLLLAVTALAVSCGSDFSAEGTYEGKLVVEDGIKFVELELLEGNTARVKGFFPNLKEGTWVKESIGKGFSKDGVMVTFDFKENPDDSFRVVFLLLHAEEGFILSNIRVRLLLEDKFSMLQPYKLKEKNPLLKRVD